jgi:hypothetical protein
MSSPRQLLPRSPRWASAILAPHVMLRPIKDVLSLARTSGDIDGFGIPVCARPPRPLATWIQAGAPQVLGSDPARRDTGAPQISQRGSGNFVLWRRINSPRHAGEHVFQGRPQRSERTGERQITHPISRPSPNRRGTRSDPHWDAHCIRPQEREARSPERASGRRQGARRPRPCGSRRSDDVAARSGHASQPRRCRGGPGPRRSRDSPRNLATAAAPSMPEPVHDLAPTKSADGLGHRDVLVRGVVLHHRTVVGLVFVDDAQVTTADDAETAHQGRPPRRRPTGPAPCSVSGRASAPA